MKIDELYERKLELEIIKLELEIIKLELEDLKLDLKEKICLFIFGSGTTLFLGMEFICAISKSILENEFNIDLLVALISALGCAFATDGCLDDIKDYISEYNTLKLKINENQIKY